MLPILVHLGYRLYHRHFFSQIFDVCLYGILGNALLIGITSLINKALLSSIFGRDLTLPELAMFSCVTSIVDPMSICSLKPNKIFHLFLGVFTFGNAIAVDLFSPTSRLAYVSNDTVVTDAAYGYLVLNSVLDLVFGVLLGIGVGLFIAVLSKMTRGERSCEYFEPGIAFVGTAVVYFLACLWTLSTTFSVVTCCLLHQRYAFNNFSIKSVMAVKDSLEAFSLLFEGLFFTLIGYSLIEVEVINVYKEVIMLLIVSFSVKSVIFLLITVVLNTKKKRPFKEMLRTVVLMVFSGSRGPHGWALMMSYGDEARSKFFSDSHVLLITISLILDTLVARTIYKRMENTFEEEKEEEVREGDSNRLVKWIADLEKKLFTLLVADEEELEKHLLMKEVVEMEMHKEKMEKHLLRKEVEKMEQNS